MSNIRNNGLSSNIRFYSALLGDTIYYIQDVVLPGIKLEGQVLSTSMGNLTLPGEVQNFSNQISLEVLIDERLETWKNLLDAFRKYNETATNLGGCGPEEISFVEIYDSKNNYLFKVEFYNSKLDSLGDLSYTTKDNAVLTTKLTLAFDYFKYE